LTNQKEESSKQELRIFYGKTNKSTTMAEQNSHMSLSVYYQNIRRMKHKTDELACSLVAKVLHPYSLYIKKTTFNGTEAFIT